MTTVVNITLREDLEPEEQEHLQGVLRDAFYEFNKGRGPSVDEYVNRQYSDERGYDQEFRDRKIITARMRRDLAEKLFAGAASHGHVTVTTAEPIEGSES